MPSRVPLSAKRSSKYDQVLGDAGFTPDDQFLSLCFAKDVTLTVNDVHRPHSSAGIVEEPFLIEIDGIAMLCSKRTDDFVYGRACVVWVVGDSALG